MNGGRLGDFDGRTRANFAVMLQDTSDRIASKCPYDASILQQLAVRILNPITGGCDRCGNPLPPIGKTGRPRKFCVSCSPRKTNGKVKA